MAKKNKYKGKFIIAFDTVVDGWQCATDEKGKPAPNLYDSEADAMFELFGDALSMLNNQTVSERKENGITAKQYSQMKKIFADGNGDPQQMADFLQANPECNYNGDFIVPADEFVFGRKTIFGKDGLKIIGEKLK